MVAACVVCAATATVYCQADKAFLCHSCDKTIHNANVLASRHCRVPVCELCKRSASTVYCHTDAAPLCDLCNGEVHTSNPIPHNVVAIELVLDGEGLRPMASARAPTAAGANDEVSECGQHCSASLAGSMISSENKTSGITVPEMPSLFESAPTGKDALWANKVFDNLDCALMDFDGFDFADILGADLADAGVVPTLRPSSNFPAKFMPVFPEDDCVVPSLEFPETFMEPGLLPPSPPAPKRSAPALEAPQPPHKVAAVSINVVKSAVPTVAPMPMGVVAPIPPPPAAVQMSAAVVHMPAAVVQMPALPLSAPPPQPPMASTMYIAHQQQQQTMMMMGGDNLTRQQRVARYLEKKKRRTFQKTIRYASRKAYAEVRPRIKGRFATREEVAAMRAAAQAGDVGA